MTKPKPNKDAVGEAAASLAARRQRTSRVCEMCGTPIEGLTRRMYCGNRCAARAYRQRLKAKGETPTSKEKDRA